MSWRSPSNRLTTAFLSLHHIRTFCHLRFDLCKSCVRTETLRVNIRYWEEDAVVVGRLCEEIVVDADLPSHRLLVRLIQCSVETVLTATPATTVTISFSPANNTTNNCIKFLHCARYKSLVCNNNNNKCIGHDTKAAARQSMAKNDFQCGRWNSYTLQCGTIMTLISPGDCTLRRGMWFWNSDSEFTKWQHPAMWYVALEWHPIEFVRWQHPEMWHVALESWHWIR